MHHNIPAGDLPQVRVLFPDGRLSGWLARRWRAADGTWVYRVAVRGWSSRSAGTGQDLVEDFIELEVPDTYVRPVPGASYDMVPALRGSRAPAPQPDTAIPADSPEGWTGERIRTAADDPDGRGPEVRFHVPGCWAIQGRTGGTLTTEQARQMSGSIRSPRPVTCAARTRRRPTASSPARARRHVPSFRRSRLERR